MSDHSYQTQLQIRFRDIDSMGHVNNAVYASYLEQARLDFFRDVIGERLDDVDTVLAHLSVDFRTPIEVDDSVTIAIRITELGESSIPMEYEIRADDELAATAETVQVAFDSETGTSRPLPDDWRRQIEEYVVDD